MATHASRTSPNVSSSMLMSAHKDWELPYTMPAAGELPYLSLQVFPHTPSREKHEAAARNTYTGFKMFQTRSRSWPNTAGIPVRLRQARTSNRWFTVHYHLL